MTLKIDLPADLREGDQLMITMAGAYTVVYGSNFNGFAVPPRKFMR
jgi:diaminopimelate decarboxylase